MSNLYNMNTRFLMYNTPLISWKGKTFTQVSTIVRMNKNTNTNTVSNNNFFLPNPLKIRRREIASIPNVSSCNQRTSIRIDELNRPNGSLVYYNKPSVNNGLVSTIDINLSSNTSDIPGNCSSCNTTTSTVGSRTMGTNGIINTTGIHAFSPTQNALKRVRSGGMVRRQYNMHNNVSSSNPSNNNNAIPVYYTDTTQYLKSRNLTFEQNQFNFLRKGDNTKNPGTNGASSNVYSANGITPCGNYAPVYYKPNNPQFAQQGGVSSSSHIQRVKYDSITNSAVIYKQALGLSVANALSYGVSENGYTMKDIIGYPNKKTPVINPYNGKISSCTPKRITHLI